MTATAGAMGRIIKKQFHKTSFEYRTDSPNVYTTEFKHFKKNRRR